ncbi:MAG: type II secretion system F family protein, partial [Deltaproteobacteria bacterium]
MLKLLILLLIFGSAGLLFAQALPNLTARYDRLLRKKTDKTVYKLDKMFYDVNRERMFLILTLTPFVLAGVAYMVTRNIAAFAGGLVLGITFPSVIIKKMEAGRKEKFRNQLIDALLTVSACLKSGLSLLQAIEVIAEEMPPPISKEFNLVLNENKVGVTLEEALERLNKRLYSEELNMLVTSILVSRHTGGD